MDPDPGHAGLAGVRVAPAGQVRGGGGRGGAALLFGERDGAEEDSGVGEGSVSGGLPTWSTLEHTI